MVFIILIPLSVTGAQVDWAITLYSGRVTDSELGPTATFDFEFENAYLVGLGLSRRIYTFQDYFAIEMEGQIAKYFGDQDNWEFCVVGYFRWLRFPWDTFLDTDFAAGAGLSYATSVPAIEAKYHEETSQFLGALMFEFAFSLPHVPQWSIVTGIHHRSGAGGVFGGVHGASNAWVIGIRTRF
jgi:hypothetical protein